jgi:hypothetical protein
MTGNARPRRRLRASLEAICARNLIRITSDVDVRLVQKRAVGDRSVVLSGADNSVSFFTASSVFKVTSYAHEFQSSERATRSRTHRGSERRLLYVFAMTRGLLGSESSSPDQTC